MSKFAQAASTSHTLSLTAMEEASRMGQREADLEHLLLALTLSEQPAGETLRSLGITVEATRRAIAAQRSTQLRSLGVDVDTAGPGRITFHETNGYQWSKRALEIITRASKGKNDGGAAAVLRELLTEPSGQIAELLEQLGTSPAALTGRLGDVKAIPAIAPTATVPPVGPHGLAHAFIPAPVEKVWALLANPARMPEWEMLAGSISPLDPAGPPIPAGRPAAEEASGDAVPADAWLTTPPSTWPDGKTVRVRKGCERRRVELVAAEQESAVTWKFSYPDLVRSNASQLAIVLTPTDGGTNLCLELSWQRGRGWRRAAGFMLAPLQRFALWMQLRQIAGGISRVYR